MNHSGGKYEELCALVRKQSEAKAAIVIILDGKLGSGFSVNSTDPALVRLLPAMLRNLALDLEEQFEARAFSVAKAPLKN